MPGIRRRSALPDSSHPSEYVGQRAAELRRVQNISQEEVADRMVTLGHQSWRRQTVAQIETAERNITVDELISLALALGCFAKSLLDPVPVHNSQWGRAGTSDSERRIDLGLSSPIPRRSYVAVLGFDPRQPSDGFLADWSDPEEPHLRHGDLVIGDSGGITFEGDNK